MKRGFDCSKERGGEHVELTLPQARLQDVFTLLVKPAVSALHNSELRTLWAEYGNRFSQIVNLNVTKVPLYFR